jgi:thiol-disulfide isomerase/thioredoxin
MCQPTETLPPAQRLRDVIAAYQAARDAGRGPTLEELLAVHPDLADELRAFFASPKETGAAPAPGAPAPGSPAGAATPVPADAPTLDPAPRSARVPATLPAPRNFADYELLAEIARGGMGVIYQARQKSLHRIVALKMILAGQLASPDQVRRFHIEAEEAGQLDHPNIVPIYQVGEEQGQHYFTMKLIEGGSLGDQVPRFLSDPRAAARLVATVARAVHYAHQHGILHRDLKPGNILVDAQGQPHVTDFGLAKHLGGQGSATQTQSGAILGTPSYVAPEQASARKDLTTAVDVYSLGAILYELLTGRPPFRAETPLDTVLQVLEQDPLRPRSLSPRLDRDLETICLTCLAKDPKRRYASAQALAEDLERFLADEPILARPVGFGERALKWVRRRPAAAALLTVSALAVLSLLMGGWWYNVRLQKALREVDQQRQAAEERQQEADDQRRIAEVNAAEAEHQRQIAEQRRQDAEGQRQQAQASAAEARRQGELAKGSFAKRLELVDDLLVRLDARLAKARAPVPIRLEFLQEAFQMNRGLLLEQKDDPSARRQAGRLQYCIGNLWDKRLQEGDAAYRKALEVQEGLVAEFPKQRLYQDDLAQTHARRAQLLQANHHLTEAQTAYRRAIQEEDRLAADSPGQPDYRERAARYRFDLANLLEEDEQPAEAEKVYRDALERQEKLVADAPKRVTAQSDLGKTTDSLALLLGASNPAEAQRYLERGLRAKRQALQLAPANQEYPVRLRDGYADLAAFLKQQGQHAELARLAADLCRDFPASVHDRYNAACFVASAAQVVRESRQIPDSERRRLAAAYGEQAVALLDKAIKEGYTARSHLDKDKDLDLLRERADFRELLGKLEKRSDTQPATPASDLAELRQEYQAAQAWYDYYNRTARTVAEKKRVERKKPHFEEFARQFLQLAEKHRDSPTAVEALIWVLENGKATKTVPEDPAAPQLREKALELLQRDHLDKAELANVCQRLAEKPQPEADKLLRAAVEKHAQPAVRGLASYALALSFAKQGEQLREDDAARAGELTQKAEEQLDQVIREYASIPYGRSTLGNRAKDKLYELRHLSIGRVAQEIVGEDLDGRMFKLSDHRGQVVVVDFWADWCGWCRQMYPHERELVKRLQGQPFALLGVNCDDDKGQAQRAVRREGLTWRSWADGARGPICEKWQVHRFPTIYVLDGKGVIRYMGVRGPDLDAAVDKLLNEQAPAPGSDKK